MILKINAKCKDLCFATLIDDDGNIVIEHDGYVPRIVGIGEDGYGDYVDLTIDTETGQIIGWQPKQDFKQIIEDA